MAIDRTLPYSRRALLGAGFGAVAALVAEALGRPRAVRAEGEAIVVGGDYLDAISMTSVRNQANDAPVFWAASDGDGTGVTGESQTGDGVEGFSSLGIGVRGTTNGTAGVFGQSIVNGTGVRGMSGNSGPGAPAKTGVFGAADQDSGAVGVQGQSGAGTGVYGKVTGAAGRYAVRGWSAATGYPAMLGHAAANSTGVYGHSGPITNPARAKTGVYGVASQDSSAVGVYGESGSGVGVQGVTASGAIGIVGLASAAAGATFGTFGRSDSPAGAGVGGRGFADSTGVIGYSGGGAFPAAKPKTGVHGYAGQDGASRGVSGESPAGHGVHGKTNTGYAGYFEGRMFTTQYLEIAEMGKPGAPGANKARLFVRDDGSNKTQLCVRFSNGVIRVLATM